MKATFSFLVLEAGLEPAQPQWPRDFKSLVSTIPPFEHGHYGCKVNQIPRISKIINE